MNIKRTTRLLKLLQRLQSGQGDNADGLAAACGVSRRTVFRDLETLREAGVPLEFEKEAARYSIASEFFLPPTNFTTAEALSIIALTDSLAPALDRPLFGPARSAALKLETSLPTTLRRELKSVAKSINVRFNPLDQLSSQQTVYDQLVQSIAERRVVEISYKSLTEWEAIDTRLRAYQLLFNRHSWYVIGRSSLHGEVRTFNLSRITRLEALPEKYVRPRGFSLERYLRNAWNLMPEPGADYHVVVRFAPLVAHNVAEVAWHRTQRVEFLEDGTLDFHADVSGLSEIVWWILGYGDQAEVLSPAKLRRLVAQRAKRMHEIYCR